MMKNVLHKSGIFLLLPLFFSLLLSGCGPSSGGASGEKVPVTLRFQVPGSKNVSSKTLSDPSAVVSMEIIVTGPGMPEINDVFDIFPGENVNRTFNVLPGPGRVFAARVFDVDNVALFEGESDLVNILPASSPNVTIILKALFLDLFSELPRFSANYILNDVPGIPAFSGLSASENYVAGVGVTPFSGKKATSTNYTLR